MANINIIDYITIASAGNATDFGDMTAANNDAAGCSSETRGLAMGGNASGYTATIDYITIATTGNASDFGDLTVARGYSGGYASGDGARGVADAGTTNGSTNSDVIDYLTIASLGNATDFGNSTLARRNGAGFSG
jgi:hypothetical protein